MRSARQSSTSAAGGQTVRWHPLALVPLVLTAWVYYPITGVFFFADDFYHLGVLTNESNLAWVLAPFGGHNYVLRNLVFLGSWQLFGFHSEPWYWTVFLTHLLNVWLLFGVLSALTTSVSLACSARRSGASVRSRSVPSDGTRCMATRWPRPFSSWSSTDSHASLPPATDCRRARPVSGTRSYSRDHLLRHRHRGGAGLPGGLVLSASDLVAAPGVHIAYLALPAVTLAVYFELIALAWIQPLSFPRTCI